MYKVQRTPYGSSVLLTVQMSYTSILGESGDTHTGTVTASYHDADPLLFSFDFASDTNTSGASETTWVVGRELLNEALSNPGEFSGNPDADMQILVEYDMVHIDVLGVAPNGSLVSVTVVVEAAPLQMLTDLSYELVPAGQEFSGVDVEQELAALLGQ